LISALIAPTVLGQQMIEPAPDFDEALLFATTFTQPQSVKSADLNFDGLPDIAVAGGDPGGIQQGLSFSGVTVYINSGTWPSPGFSQVIHLELAQAGGCQGAGGCLGQELVIANLDGDVWPDIAVTVKGFNGSHDWLVVFKNLMGLVNPPDPPFQATTYALPDVHRFHGLVAADVNNDGKLDLMAAGANDPSGNPADAMVLRLDNNGTGGFPSQLLIPIPGVTGSAWDIVSGDFDGDSDKPDLATSNLTDDTITVLHRDPTDLGDGYAIETLTRTVTNPAWQFGAIAAGRLDSDTVRELVCTEQIGNHNHGLTLSATSTAATYTTARTETTAATATRSSATE